MNSELKVLKKIWENNGKTHTRLISFQTGLGINYIHYLCNCLLKNGKIEMLKGKKNWYKITSQGKKELKIAGIIKSKSSGKDLQKVIYYFPKKLKSKPQEPKIEKSKIIKAKEKKLNLGKEINKTVSFLKSL